MGTWTDENISLDHILTIVSFKQEKTKYIFNFIFKMSCISYIAKRTFEFRFNVDRSIKYYSNIVSQTLTNF